MVGYACVTDFVAAVVAESLRNGEENEGCPQAMSKTCLSHRVPGQTCDRDGRDTVTILS
jgi:hypothetical protein